jgi:hypothetical protein
MGTRPTRDLEFTLWAGGIFWLPYALLRQGLSQVPSELRGTQIGKP